MQLPKLAVRRKPAPLIQRDPDAKPRPGQKTSPKTETWQAEVSLKKIDIADRLVQESGGKHYWYDRNSREHFYRFNSIADAAACLDTLTAAGIGKARCRASSIIIVF